MRPRCHLETGASTTITATITMLYALSPGEYAALHQYRGRKYHRLCFSLSQRQRYRAPDRCSCGVAGGVLCYGLCALLCAIHQARDRSSVAEQGPFKPLVEGSNPSGPTSRPAAEAAVKGDLRVAAKADFAASREAGFADALAHPSGAAWAILAASSPRPWP